MADDSEISNFSSSQIKIADAAVAEWQYDLDSHQKQDFGHST